MKPQPQGKVAVYIVFPMNPYTPVDVIIQFNELGFESAVSSAGVRDLWAQKDIGDATGAVLNVTVMPFDSRFLVLTPKSKSNVIV